MPAYYPDLNSVAIFAARMKNHSDDAKKYYGIVPQTEGQLPNARKQLGAYMRKVWQDEIAALEIELAVEPHNYHEKLRAHVAMKMFGGL